MIASDCERASECPCTRSMGESVPVLARWLAVLDVSVGFLVNKVSLSPENRQLVSCTIDCVRCGPFNVEQERTTAIQIPKPQNGSIEGKP